MKYFFVIAFILNSSSTLFAQNWNSLQTGLDRAARCLFHDTVTGTLYVGGGFKTAGQVNARGIASWNGSDWDSLGSGMDAFSSSFPNNVLCITRYNNLIYAGGSFSQAGSVSAQYIACWNGSVWDSLDISINNAVTNMYVMNGEIYICGTFNLVDTIIANGLVKYNGVNWSTVNNIPNFNTDTNDINYIFALSMFNGLLYVAGNFDGANGLSSIVYWDSSGWHSLGNGIVGTWGMVSCMAVYKNELYVGGPFRKNEGNTGDFIQKWNGSTWSEVGGGVSGIGGNGQVDDLAVIDGYLYVVGKFDHAGNVPAQYIARWDGISWCGLGASFNNTIGTLTKYNNNIVIGGGFTTVDGNNINYVSEWTAGNYVDTCEQGVGVEELPINLLNIHPNPTFGKFTVTIPRGNIVTIIISDLLGRKLKEYDFKNITGDFVFDLEKFDNGVYLVTVIIDEVMSTARITKTEY